MAEWTTATNTSLLTTFLIRKFVTTLENELQYEKFCLKAVIPPGQGKIGRWNRWTNPPGSTTALDEGTQTGGEITLTTDGVDATIAEYGEFYPFSSLAELAAVGESRTQLSDRMSYGAALSLDTGIRAGFSPASATGAIDTTLDFYCTAAQTGGQVTAATPLAGSASAIIGSAKLLRDNGVSGHRGVSGHPDGHFAAVVTPKYELDMVTEATTTRMTWSAAVTNVPGNSGQEKWVNGYMGSVYGTACYRTQNFSTTPDTTLTVTSENSFVIGAEGLGCLSMRDADPQVFINTASAGDIGNPYRNKNTVAWHMFQAAALIDANRVVRVYSAAQ